MRAAAVGEAELEGGGGGEGVSRVEVAAAGPASAAAGGDRRLLRQRAEQLVEVLLGRPRLAVQLVDARC